MIKDTQTDLSILEKIQRINNHDFSTLPSLIEEYKYSLYGYSFLMDIYPRVLDDKDFLLNLRKCIGKESQCLYSVVIHIERFNEPVAVYRQLTINEDNSLNSTQYSLEARSEKNFKLKYYLRNYESLSTIALVTKVNEENYNLLLILLKRYENTKEQFSFIYFIHKSIRENASFISRLKKYLPTSGLVFENTFTEIIYSGSQFSYKYVTIKLSLDKKGKWLEERSFTTSAWLDREEYENVFLKDSKLEAHSSTAEIYQRYLDGEVPKYKYVCDAFNNDDLSRVVYEVECTYRFLREVFDIKMELEEVAKISSPLYRKYYEQKDNNLRNGLKEKLEIMTTDALNSFT